MREIIRFFERFHFFVLFILLEIISINILIKHNHFYEYKSKSILSFIRESILKVSYKINEFSKLKLENRKLIEENNKLYKYYTLYQKSITFDSISITKIIINRDSISFTFLPAKIVNLTTNNQYNYITIKAGKKNGVIKEMAAISYEGLVGHVIDVSDNFSIILPIININYQVSAKLKKNNFTGILTWEGENYQFATLKDIPVHADVHKGDTIITSGFSSIYPEGILIGLVHDYYTKEGIFYSIKVKLSTDFKRLCNVQLINNPLKEEQETIEQKYFKEKNND